MFYSKFICMFVIYHQYHCQKKSENVDFHIYHVTNEAHMKFIGTTMLILLTVGN